MKVVKKILLLILCIQSLSPTHGFSQGWTAEIDLDFNHNLYAYEKITSASFTYSGVTVTGSSETSNLHLVIKGTGPISGDIYLTANGLAWQPYQPDDPYSEPIAAFFAGNYSQLCSLGFFEKDGETSLEQIYIWITIYPRLAITGFNNNCDELNFTTVTCSPTFTWEAGENISGNFKVIPAKSTASITLTRQELIDLGFTDPFGRKYFRVTGKPGTTSQLQPVDIFYPPPTASIYVIPPRCHDGSDGVIQVNIISANPTIVNDFVATLFSDATLKTSIKQEFINDGSQITFSGLPAGNYWVKIENNTNIGVYGNCSTVYTAPPLQNPDAVTIPSFAVSDFNGYAVRCKGGSDGNIEAKPSGGTGIFTTYEWTPSVSTTDAAQNLTEGSYAIRVKDSNGCWSEAYTKILEAPERLSLNLISTGGKNGFDVSCTDKKDGKIETSISGGIAAYSYLWSDGSTTSSMSNAGPGSYELRITDANGCTAQESMSLLAPQSIDFTLAEITGINCPGDRSGILEVQSTVNAIGQIYYAWSSGEYAKEITDKPSGTYSVTVSDDQGCMAKKSHTLAEPPPWSMEIVALSDYNGSVIRCNGDENGELAMFVKDDQGNVATADQYTWYKNDTELISGAGFSSLDGLSAGIYRGRITYGNFCQTEKTFVLNEPSPVQATISNLSNYNGMSISCFGQQDGSIKVSAVGGAGAAYQYRWDSGETGSVLTGIGSGTYRVAAKDVNGCEGTAEKILEEPEPVNTVISVLSDFNGQPVSCAGASDARLRASATGGVSDYTYRWNTGSEGHDLLDIGAGIYSLTATDINGCTGSSEITLINPEPVIARISAHSDYHGFGVSCQGADDGYLLAEGSGGTGNYQFTWLNSANSKAFYPDLSAGNYSFEVKDENGCTAVAQGVVTEPLALSLQVSSVKNVSCNNGNDGEIELVGNAGAGDYKYAVDGQNWQSAPEISGLHAGAYVVKIKDGNNCIGETTTALTEPNAISVSFPDVEPALCGEPQGKASATVTGGTGGYTYAWTDSENRIFSNGPDIDSLAAGIYTLKVIDQHSCGAMEAVAITSADGPKVQIENVIAASCSYSSDGRAQVIATEGNGPFTYLWQDGQTTDTATHLAKGNYLVEITDINKCTAVETATIPAPDSLHIELLEKVELTCHGECNGRLSVTAKGGNGNYSYEWQDFSGDRRTDLCAGSYKVKVIDDKQCIASDTFVLGQPEPVLLTLKQIQPLICHEACDGKIEVECTGGTGALEFQWSAGQTTPLIENLCAGSFTVRVIDMNNCSAKKTFVLEDPAPLPLDLGGPITLCAGKNYTLDAGSNWQIFSWSGSAGFSSTMQRVTIDQPGAYWLEAVNSQGCHARDTFLLETTTDLLKANFLLTSQAMVMDTIVMIDISWPLPEQITWSFPEEMKRLDDSGDIVHGQFEYPGVYDVSLAATLGECRDMITKAVTIISGEKKSGEGRFGTEPFVKEFHLFPNPNEGMFDVVVAFMEESSMALSVWNVLTTTKIAQVADSGRMSYEKHFDLWPLSAGTYTLRLDYGKGTKYIRFIVR